MIPRGRGKPEHRLSITLLARFGLAVICRSTAATALSEPYLGWLSGLAGAHQALCLVPTCLRHGHTTREVRYAITSLGPEVEAATLLAHLRGHWTIENRLHGVRDVTLGEDACAAR